MPFKQSEVERAVKGVQARKLPISAVEVDPHTGMIKISIGIPSSDKNQNPWDEVLTK